jgi:hypothetical protein
MGNLPDGCTALDIDHLIPDEPEYELTEADLAEAYLDRIDMEAINCPTAVFYEYDALLVDCAIKEARMARWAA